MAFTALAMQAAPAADRLCETARAAAEQFAAARGWQADVRCRAPGGVVAADAALQAIDPPQDVPSRSGPGTWAVRVQAPNAAAYVQRVPVTVSWHTPAWVSRHDLAAGAVLQADDVEMQSRRWPDGLVVMPARHDAPPVGRLRQAVRAGEAVVASQMLPPDARVRGDHVTAVLSEGAMEVRMPAQLLAAVRVGERVRVQVQGRPVALEGRLADAQTVKVDSE
jgi:flagella basal body P-ring formation protein FlgA